MYVFHYYFHTVCFLNYWSIQGINFHCLCQKVYSPVLDSQRYCGSCEKWFDIWCLGEPRRARKMSGPLGLQLANAPIARGWISSPPADWMTVGSGRLVKKALKKYSTKEHCDWELLLGRSFLSYLTDAPPSFFQCPSCDNLIWSLLYFWLIIWFNFLYQFRSIDRARPRCRVDF